MDCARLPVILLIKHLCPVTRLVVPGLTRPSPCRAKVYVYMPSALPRLECHSFFSEHHWGSRMPTSRHILQNHSRPYRPFLLVEGWARERSRPWAAGCGCEEHWIWVAHVRSLRVSWSTLSRLWTRPRSWPLRVSLAHFNAWTLWKPWESRPFS